MVYTPLFSISSSFSLCCSTQLVRYASECKRQGRECRLRAVLLFSSLWNMLESSVNLNKLVNRLSFNRYLAFKYTQIMKEWVGMGGTWRSSLVMWRGSDVSVSSHFQWHFSFKIIFNTQSWQFFSPWFNYVIDCPSQYIFVSIYISSKVFSYWIWPAFLKIELQQYFRGICPIPHVLLVLFTTVFQSLRSLESKEHLEELL